MTPETAVTKLLEIMGTLPTLRQDIIYNALDKADISAQLGVPAFMFTQIVCGRVFLEDMTLNYPNEYYILDGVGNILESGRLDENPFFIAAQQLAQKYKGTAEFDYMAQTSSLVRTINAALEKSWKPENLLLMPEVLFFERATDQGMRKMQQIYTEYVDAFKARQAKLDGNSQTDKRLNEQ